jgi:hypothetical protein
MVQVSEFANNDLEKYGKALDKWVGRVGYHRGAVLTRASAILRYHSIKMDEINDTIGHLWNKTYQGTGAWILSPPQSTILSRVPLGSFVDRWRPLAL